MDFTLPPLLTSLVDRGNGLLWGSVLIYLLIGAGLYFTVMTRGIQLRYFGHMFKLLGSSRQSNGGISSFQALSTSLAARVGTGNLAGVAVAIYFGGPGAIFWMWMTAMVGMATSFVERSGQLYRPGHGTGVRHSHLGHGVSFDGCCGADHLRRFEVDCQGG